MVWSLACCRPVRWGCSGSAPGGPEGIGTAVGAPLALQSALRLQWEPIRRHLTYAICSNPGFSKHSLHKYCNLLVFCTAVPASTAKTIVFSGSSTKSLVFVRSVLWKLSFLQCLRCETIVFVTSALRKLLLLQCQRCETIVFVAPALRKLLILHCYPSKRCMDIVWNPCCNQSEYCCFVLRLRSRPMPSSVNSCREDVFLFELLCEWQT